MKALEKCAQIFKLVLRGLVFLLFLTAFLLGVVLIAARLAGYQTLAVRTGSMQEKYPVGTLLIVDSSSPEEIQVGDVISFVADENLTVVTHRVVRINAEEKSFITKGDSNNTVDSQPVLYENLVGRVRFGIPLLGYVILFLQKNYAEGTLYLVLVGIFLVVLGRWVFQLLKHKI